MNGEAGNLNWQKIEPVLAAFLELPSDQKAAYLAQQPPSIRKEVESLLEAYRQSGDFLGNETGTGVIFSKLKLMLESAGAEPSSRGAGPLADSDKEAPFTLSSGTNLGPYRIDTVIGKGGMGVVYRALDTRLNRPVAVKFLFDSLADSAARRRFQREAQMASSLNHPHILTVLDAGDFEGRQYLVTEFIDGGTLKDWARNEQHTWREIVGLLAGVADGLAAAHAAGILHRDIKPDNILVGRNGYAKLSDFGLAKLEERNPPEEATQTLTGTRPGFILGTFAYMSPEQASGRAVDARSDIFSFGILLYELLAGKRPFAGATDQELLRTIIHGTPPPLSADVPLALRMLVEKALENAPSDRYQSTRDLVVDLRRLVRQSGDSSGSAAVIAAPPPTKRSAKIGMLAAAIFALVLGGGALLFWVRPPATEAQRQVIQFDISALPGTIFTPTITRQPFAISPDGKRLAFSATDANGTNVWIRDLASPDLRTLPGTEGAWSIFWAPDSRSIFFSVKRVLKQFNLETGSGRTVAELPWIAQVGTWRSNGDLLLYLGTGDWYGLHLEDGSIQKGPVFPGMRWPQFLPGGDRFVYVVYDKALLQTHAVATDYGNRHPVSLMQTDSRVQYALPLQAGNPGSLLFIRGASLLAQSFDANRVKLAGKPLPIAPNVIYYGPTHAANFSVSENGVLVYQAGFPNSQLKWYDRTGRDVGEAGRPSQLWGNVRISRDGRRSAASVWNPDTGGPGIWIFDAHGTETRRITFPPEIHRRPVWSPDGTRLAFGGSRTVGGPKLATMDLVGNRPPQEFASQAGDQNALPTDWSSDGRFIAFDDGVGEEQHVASVADLSSGKIEPMLKNDFPQWGIAFAPDGKSVAFVSLESGRPEVYIQGFEPTPSPHVVGERRQVSRDGAWLVRWRGDGRELFYLGLDNVLQAAAIQGPLQPGDSKSLFRIPGAPQYGTTRDFQFDVSPDGQRFIIPATGTTPPPPFTVIENWQEKFSR